MTTQPLGTHSRTNATLDGLPKYQPPGCKTTTAVFSTMGARGGAQLTAQSTIRARRQSLMVKHRPRFWQFAPATTTAQTTLYPNRFIRRPFMDTNTSIPCGLICVNRPRKDTLSCVLRAQFSRMRKVHSSNNAEKTKSFPGARSPYRGPPLANHTRHAPSISPSSNSPA